MRVLVCSPWLIKSGGVAGFYKTIRDNFTVDVDYFTVGSRADDEHALLGFVRFIADNIAFYRTITYQAYDIVHLNPSLNFKAVARDGLLLLLAKTKGKRVVVFFHGWRLSFESKIMGRYAAIFKYVFGKADGFIVLASAFKSTLVHLGFTQPVYLMTTVVDEKVFRDVNESVLASKFRDRNGRFVILFLSRIEKTKGIYEAIESYRLLKKDHPIVTMRIAGDGSELAAVKAYVQQQGIKDVEFMGYVVDSNKVQAFADADVYLFPTYGEGMPISVLEAMLGGLPIITRAVGGLRDFFEEGKMGFLTDSLEPKVFAGLLEKLFLDRDCVVKMGLYNHRYARHHFVPSKVVEKLEQVYQDIVNA